MDKNKFYGLIGGIALILLVVFVVYFVLPRGPGYTEFEVNELGYILLDHDGTIKPELCLDRNLDEQIIVIEQEGCHACELAIPKLKKIEDDLQTEFIYLDLKVESEREKLSEFRVTPVGTPTVLVGCKVLRGVETASKYRKAVESFLESQLTEQS